MQARTPVVNANAIARSAASAGPTNLEVIAPAAQAQSRNSFGNSGQAHVLIVMHDTTERLLLERMCQVEGCEVHASETGVEALQIIAKNEGTYALCLIDTMLPDMEPRSLCSQIFELIRGGARCKLSAHAFIRRSDWCVSLKYLPVTWVTASFNVVEF
jgi:CheY-like chemotaxis protein